MQRVVYFLPKSLSGDGRKRIDLFSVFLKAGIVVRTTLADSIAMLLIKKDGVDWIILGVS